METVQWSIHCNIHYRFLRSGQTITADVYYAELQTTIVRLVLKQPRLVNRSSPLLLYDNATHYTARKAVVTLQDMQLETKRRPPYSPGLAPMDYRFFVIQAIFCVVNILLPYSFSNLYPQTSIAKVQMSCRLDVNNEQTMRINILFK